MAAFHGELSSVIGGRLTHNAARCIEGCSLSNPASLFADHASAFQAFDWYSLRKIERRNLHVTTETWG